MRPAPLRPLGVGEILDVGINICLRHAGTLLRLTLGIAVPVGILSTLINVSAVADDEQDDGQIGTGGIDATGQTSLPDDSWTELAGLGASTLVTLLAAVFATTACFRALSEAYLGRSPDWRQSYRFAAPRFLPVLWVTMLTVIGAMLGLVLLVVGAIAFYVFWSVAVPVVLAEDVRGTRALRRSWSLVRGRWWPAFGVLVIGSILGGIVSVGLLAVTDLVVPGESDSVGRIVADGLAQVLGSAIATPLTAAFTVVLYFDLRVRKEGFDLELLADRLAGRAVPSGPLSGGPPEIHGDDRPLW